MKLPVYTVREPHRLIGALDAEKILLGCSETGVYRIRVPDENARLYADDALLEMDGLHEYWIWQPGFFAGEVAFELELPGKTSPLSFVVDVAPAEHKSGREQYADYLKQIINYAPELVAGTEPAKQDFGGRSNAVSLWLRYARLRQFIDRYLSGLKAILDRPIIRLSSRREQVPLHMATRVDGISMQRLANNPNLLAALNGSEVDDTEATAWDHRLDVPFHEPTMDNPANRLIARQLGEVRRLTRFLLAEMAKVQSRTSETETDLIARLPRRALFLQTLDKRLGRLGRIEPFASADIAKQGTAEFNAVASNPYYNMTYQIGVRILRQGLTELADDEKHYLAPTWEIYESWCFVAIAEELEARFPWFEWELNTNPVSADLILSGKSGDKEITLYFQMTCNSMESSNRYGYCSISRERRPDLVLELTESGEKRFVCLDSKYTASRSGILEAMASAHIYQDSLRCETLAPILSVILVPANPILSVLSNDEYLQRHHVGCFTLSDKSQTSLIIDRLLCLP